jgi:hypothetical protein
MRTRLNKLMVIGILIVLSSSYGYSQDINQEEINTQLKMVAEITYLRGTVATLESQKQVLTETLKLKEEIQNLKDQQIKVLLDVINRYEELKNVYESQISLQQEIIVNNNGIIAEYQKVTNKNNTLNTIKTILYTMLGVLIGKI